MRKNPLREKLDSGKPVLGTFVSLPDPGIVEAIGYAGYDFVILDMEHSPIDFNVLRILMAAADGAGVAPLVRVGTTDANPILRVLDTGALGVMAPHIKSRKDAQALVSACRYPPAGIRGALSASRANNYGQNEFLNHVQHRNREILTIPLIEDPEGVDNIQEIMSVEGIDVVCPGPGDLSAALGLFGQLQHPTVQAHVERVSQAVREHPACILGYQVMHPSQLERCKELGARFIIYSQDSRVIYNAYHDALTALRRGL